MFAGGLYPPDTATVVRGQGGQVITTDGPFPEAKEQLGGVWVIAAPDLDAALAWAAELDLNGYHLFHATRADMLRRLGRPAQAAAAYEAAIARASNRAERAFLEQRRDSLREEPPAMPGRPS